MLHYCKKCGRVVDKNNLSTDKNCDYCKSVVYPVPEKYWLNGSNFLINTELKNLLREELVKTSPEFDQYLFDHRDGDLRRRWAKYDVAMAHGKAILEGKDKGNKFGISCPYCKATNVKKISSTSKAVKIGFLGIFGAIDDAGKQWKCTHCGSKF